MKFTILESVIASYNGDLLYRRGGPTYFIYKNPTGQELNSKEDSKNNRAVLDSEGNLYMEARWLEGENSNFYDSQMIHDDLLRILHKNKILLNLQQDDWFDNDKFFEFGVLLQRRENTNNFYLAESYYTPILKKSSEIIETLFKKGKEKNPFINFHQDKINWLH